MKMDGELFETCADAAAFLEPADALLDDAASTISSLIEANSPVVLCFFILLVWNDRADSATFNNFARRLSAVSLVSREATWAASRTSQTLRNGDSVQERFDASGFMLLTGSDMRNQRSSLAVSNQVELGSKPASAAPQRMVRRFVRVPLSTFLSAPAAAREARICVPSMHHKSQSMRPSRSSRICKASSIRSKTFALRHREKVLYAVFQGGNRSGRSRQGAPVCSIQKIALRICRGSRGFRPVFALFGSSGSTNAHCSSDSSCRFMSCATPKGFWSCFVKITMKNEFRDRA